MEIAVSTQSPKSTATTERTSGDLPVTNDPRETRPRSQPATPRTSIVKASGAQAAPTLAGALKPNPCAAYVGAWRLSSGERVTFIDNERVELTAGETVAPRFGRWNCTGRYGETLYMLLERERTIVFTASGDGTKLYQRPDRNTVTPLQATRESAPQ
jgi:hypothetical protein